MHYSLSFNKAIVQRIILAFITLAIFWDGLWAGQPRADQIIYLHHVSGMEGFWEILKTAPAFNRWFAGDTILYRPVLYILLGTWYSLFGDNYFLWQLADLMIHISTLLVLHAILWRAPVLRGTLLPFAMVLLYGSSEMGAEMVLWNHINGYLLFALLGVLQLWFLLKFFASGDRRFAVLSVVTCFIAVFTYELGMVLAFLNACFLILMGRNSRFQISQRIPASSAPPALCFKLAGIFIVVSFCYPLVSFLDMELNSKSFWDHTGGFFLDFQFGKTIQWAAVYIGHWLYGLLVPTVVDIRAGARTEIFGYQYGLSASHIINYSAVTLAALSSLWLLIKLRWKDFSRMAVPLLLSLGFLMAYSSVIMVGRVLLYVSEGESPTFTDWVYYSNFPQLAFLATLGLALISLGKPARRLRASGKPAWIKASHFLLAGLLCLAVLNGTETARLTDKHRELQAPVQKMLTALETWHDAPALKRGDYYTVSLNCQNDSLPWFDERYIRLGSDWKGPFTFAEALYPETSYSLNKIEADRRGARVTTVECSEGGFTPKGTAGKSQDNAITHEIILGHWTYERQPTFVTYSDSQLMLINEHGDTSMARLEGKLLVALDWRIEGRLSASKNEIFWNNGTVWKR